MNSMLLTVQATWPDCKCSSSQEPESRICGQAHTTDKQKCDNQSATSETPKHTESNRENKCDITQLMVEHMGWENYHKLCVEYLTNEYHPSIYILPSRHQKSSEVAHAAPRRAFAAAQAGWKKSQTIARLLCRAGQSIRQWLYQGYGATYSNDANPPNEKS